MIISILTIIRIILIILASVPLYYPPTTTTAPFPNNSGYPPPMPATMPQQYYTAPIYPNMPYQVVGMSNAPIQQPYYVMNVPANTNYPVSVSYY